MRCPHCKREIEDAAVTSAAASIQGRRSHRKLTKRDARAMQRKSVAARKRNKASRPNVESDDPNEGSEV